MPQVPGYSAPQIQERNAPNVRISPDASVEAFGGGAAISQPTQAAQGLIEVIQKERQKANDIAVTEADYKANDLKNSMFYDTKTGAMNRKGKDAFAAIDEYQQSYSKQLSNIEDNLNGEQRAQFKLKAVAHLSDFTGQLQRHAFAEGKAYDDQVTDSGIKSYHDQATKNWQTPGAVEAAQEQQKIIFSKYAERNGLAPEVAQQRVGEIVSKTSAEVVQSMLASGNTQAAQDYVAKNKDKLVGQDSINVDKALEDGKTLDTSVETWKGVQGMRLPDGTPDEAKMQAQIFAREDLSPEKKEKVWSYVKAKSSEQLSNKSRMENANERNFLNTVTQLKKSGTPLDVAMRQTDKFAIDPYDKTQKEAALRKLYAPTEASNPEKFISLWEGVQNGTASKQDIDTAMHKNDINVADWRALREDVFKGDIDGKNPQAKLGWDRVKILAEEKFGSDKEGRDKFLYELRQDGQGKSPDEVFKMANDKLKSDPGSGWVFKSAQWKTDLAKRDAQSLAWGKAYNDIGKPTTMAIGQGMSMIQKKPFSPADLDAFANSFGGYQNIQPGKPANNAVQSLMKIGKPATPKNVQWVLEHYPDGKF